MKKYFLIITTLIAFTVILNSCGNKETEVAEKAEKAEAGHGEHEEESPNVAELTQEQIKSIGIELGTIEEKQLTASVKVNGVLKVPNQNKATVNSLYSGVVKSLLVQPGNYVKKGQPIATVANPEFIQVQSDLLNVNSKMILAELEVKRQKELNAGNAGALKNLQSAESELRTLRTLKSTLSQQIQLMGINPAKLSGGKLISVLAITSPINGVVSNVMVKMGSYVDVTTAVAEIVDNSQLHLDLFVYEKDLPKLKNNQTIHFTITNNPGKEYDAQIFSLGSSFEGDSKAVTVHAMVKGEKNGLIDGMNVTAVVSLEKATVPAVPNEAIVTVEGKDYIFVLMNDEPVKATTDTATHDAAEKHEEHEGEIKFERIPVAKGGTDIGYTEITLLKEIPKDAKIVTKGAFFVSAKMTNTEGHEH
ncbi:MAG: efflux RND transporter periplasmic adaptor subunit [Bacteroidota bacterium]